MKVFWVFAHPEPRSFNAALMKLGMDALARTGHEVRVSDLYAMKWKAVADQADFQKWNSAEPFDYMAASQQAYAQGSQLSDVIAEQEKLLWADLLVLQFPFWWFSMPAILKGWIDRTFANGLAYGLPDPDMPLRSWRYGKGRLAGRRAMVITTTSSRASALGPRGVGGNLEDLLFPLHHGVLWYTGMAALPPVLIHNVGPRRMTAERFEEAARALEGRLLSAETTTPIPYRYQNSDDYDDDLALAPDIDADLPGFRAHLRRS